MMHFGKEYALIAVVTCGGRKNVLLIENITLKRIIVNLKQKLSISHKIQLLLSNRKNVFLEIIYKKKLHQSKR